MALVLRDWLPLVLHFAEPWLSETDIAAGERWADAVAQELEACNFGILCVTPENLNSPWILFEAGSLAKSLSNSRVIPLLLDLELSETSGPLAQFQAKKIDEAGVRETVQSINRSAPDPIQDERERELFDALWQALERKLKAIPAPKDATKPARTQHQILEDLVASVRSLEAKVRDIPDYPSRSSHRRGGMRPMMLRELVRTGEPGDPLVPLMLAGLIRDELPWLYDLALDAYRAAQSDDAEVTRTAAERFRRASRFLVEGPFLEEIAVDPRTIRYILREFEEYIDSARHIERPARKPRPRAKKTSEPNA